MPTIGLSKPYYAVYNNNEGAVTYADGGSLGKAKSANIQINTTDDNDFYADNAISESDRSFSDGTLAFSPDDLSQKVSKAILGVVEQALGNIPGITDENVTELIYDERQKTPYLGVGFIIKKKKDGSIRWRAIVLTKVMFEVPEDAADTQEGTIEWKVPELSAKILRDDTEHHMWKREATFTTEAQGEIYIKHLLNISASAVAVQSSAKSKE